MKPQDSSKSRTNGNQLVSVVLPAYNEAAVLEHLYHLIKHHLELCEVRHEIVFVNDGSSDNSQEILQELAEMDPDVKVIEFSRNFGHQAAVHAGLCHARGDAIILMDSDLQDDPASIRDFIGKWEEGFDVVYAIRTERKENVVKRFLFYSFYRVLNFVSATRMPMDAGIFGLIDRAVAQQIIRMHETDRYYPGLRQWVGFRQTGIPVQRGERHDDNPRVSLFQLFQLAKTAIISFSRVPLSLFYFIAIFSIVVCILCSSFTIYHKLVTSLAVPGWASITIVASLFGALNSLGIAVLGEYVVRIYDQVRGRPKFVVANYLNFSQDCETACEYEILQSIDRLDHDVRKSSRRRDETPSQSYSSLLAMPLDSETAENFVADNK